MFIPYFEICKHLQFTLPEIIKIEAEFSSPLQIIIGTNGAGKTTLLREFNPLPAQSSDYATGGYKRMIILDKGNRYFLESFFGKPVKHTFELNGENLNVSGKETEQRKLVKEHFGLTPQLIKLVTGEILFSDLSAQARRDWLMSISGMNFEYAMQLFQKVKDFNRDANALTKSMVGREADELEKLNQIGDTSIMKARANELSQVITKLMRMQSDEKLRSASEIERETQHKLHQIKTRSHQIIKELPRRLVYQFEQFEDIDSLKIHIQTLIRENERTREELKELYRKKEDLLKLTEKTREGGLSLEDESIAIKSLRADIEQLKSNPELPYPLFLEDEILFSSLDEFHDKFRITVNGYIDNSQLRFNSERYKELKSLESSIHLQSTELSKQLNGITHAIKHQLEMPDADCPDCGKHFKIGNAEQKIESLEKEQSLLQDQLQEQLDRKAKVEDSIKEFLEFNAARKDLFLVLDSNPAKAIKKLKSLIEAKEKDGVGPRGLQDLLEEWFEMVSLSRRVVNLQKELEGREYALKHLMEVEELRKHYEGTQLDDVDHEIDRMLRQVQEARTEIQQAEELVEITTRHLKQLNELWQMRDSLKDDLNEFTKFHEQKLINETLLALQTELATIQTTVSKVDSIQHTLDNLASYRSEYERDSQASKLLMEMLSPNTGLIAEYVLSFLEDFTEEINRLLSQVWEYEMEILPCKLDAEVIDYKFPVRIANDERIRKDIAETSKGQLAFINLAFRLVIMSTVDKTILPLYLDEPTEGFDEMHCENFVRFIKGYLEQGATEQIFMVSHDFAGHASFTNAETLVLDEKNVLNKPHRYNQHVKFTHA